MPPAPGLGTRPRSDIEADLLASVLMGFGGLPQHRGQGGLVHMKVVFARAAHGLQNMPATLCLFADQIGIFLQFVLPAELFEQL